MDKISFSQVFKGSTNVLGNNLTYPETNHAEVEHWVVTLPPQSFGDWHIHLVPEFFYVTSGKLYVVNELENAKYAVAIFGKGHHGLTDCHVPQFIWNPDKNDTTVVSAVYFGACNIAPTKSLGKRPEEELLSRLFHEATQDNQTEVNNQVKKR